MACRTKVMNDAVHNLYSDINGARPLNSSCGALMVYIGTNCFEFNASG